MSNETLPLSFRSPEVDKIFSYIKSADSCSIVGIGSIGKSNLLRFLLQDDIRHVKLGQDEKKYLFVYVDIDKLLRQTDWELFGLMINQLKLEFLRQLGDVLMAESIDALYESSVSPDTQQVAFHFLERAIFLICNQLGYKIVFLIDEFDHLCHIMHPRVFAALRALRDDYKRQLTFVVAARKSLTRLYEERIDIEGFEELVTPNTIWLAPYSEEDASDMLQSLAIKHKVVLSQDFIHDAIVRTGGHPGLLRVAFPILCEQPRNLDDALLFSLEVQDECQRIWQSISIDEQKALISFIRNNEPSSPRSNILNRLHAIGFIGGTWAAPNEIFSPIMAKYINHLKPSIGAHIRVERQKHLVFIDDRKIEELAPLEYKLMELLDENRGRIITRDEIAQYLYPVDMQPQGKNVTDERIDAVIKRLRKAIELESDDHPFIITVRGHGIKLMDGEDGDTNSG